MKIRTKFILTFLIIVTLTVCGLSYYVSNIMTENVKNEKALSYDMYLHQLVNNVSLLTKETEQAFYNQYVLLNVAALVQSSQMPALKKASVENTLVSLPLNISHISSVLIEDQEKNIYFASSGLDDRADNFELVLQEDCVRENFTIWYRDGAGRLFLKKDLYRLYPLSKTGIIVAQINEESFRSALGLDDPTEGDIAVFTTQGKLLTSDAGTDSPVFSFTEENMFEASISPGKTVQTEKGDYWMVSRPSGDGKWLAVMLVPMQVILAAPIALGRIIWLGTLAILGIAVLLIFAITWKMSGNVRRLLISMDEVSHGHFDAEIPAAGRDEIGQLADRFRWMTGELKTVTEAQVRQAMEKQKSDYEMLELRYRSLQAQISPHFICNVLTTIDALTLMGKTGEVSKLSIRASRYLRDNLRSTDAKYHSLDEEIRFVKEYVELYRNLYQNGFSFSVEVDDNVPECRVPTMLIQPLVENALVHGYPTHEPDEAYHIRVEISMAGEQLQIRICNNGETIGSEIIEMVKRAGNDHEYNKKMKGFGLRSVLQRLYLMYGSRQRLCIETLPDGQTAITMCFPCEPLTPEEAGPKEEKEL